MKPPNIATPPPDQSTMATQQAQPALNSVSITSVTNSNSSQPVIIKPQATTTQVQQAPLALITQPQTQIGAQSQTPQHQQTTIPTTQSQPQNQQIPLLQSKIQPSQVQPNTTQPEQQPIPMTKTSTLTGPTALVIIPQHSTTTPANHITTPAKSATIPLKQIPITTTVGITTAHVTLTTTNQATPIQLQASPITTNMTNIITVPITAHQQSSTVVQPTLVNRPPSTLPVVPTTNTLASVKSEPNKICCLLDNGVRCDRIAGNASFTGRILKIVGTKKMNFALDPTVRHSYICEDHKGIITVAKKSTALARDTKSNARNYTANNNALVSQPDMNFNDFSSRQQTLQHPVNLDLINNQNRMSHNHTGTLNNMPIRQGAQIAYSIYQGAHPNQVGFDNVGGDDVPSSSGGIDVDLQQLQVNTLRRYKRHFRVQTRPGLNKLQLAESLKGHFKTLPIIEKEAITYFVYIVKCYRNKLDHNPKAD